MDGSTPKPEAGSVPIVNEGQLQQGFEPQPEPNTDSEGTGGQTAATGATSQQQTRSDGHPVAVTVEQQHLQRWNQAWEAAWARLEQLARQVDAAGPEEALAEEWASVARRPRQLLKAHPRRRKRQQQRKERWSCCAFGSAAEEAIVVKPLTTDHNTGEVQRSQTQPMVSSAGAEEGVPPDVEQEPECEPESELDGSLPRYLAHQCEINSFIEDPIDSTRLHIMEQCVNVSISSANTSGKDAIEAICSRCCLPKPDGAVEVCISNQWTPARFIAQGTDGVVDLTVGVTSGDWWSDVAQSDEADVQLSIEGMAVQLRGSVTSEALPTDSKQWTATVQSHCQHPSHNCTGTEVGSVAIRTIPMQAEVHNVRLRTDPSHEYRVTTIEGGALAVNDLSAVRIVKVEPKSPAALNEQKEKNEVLTKELAGLEGITAGSAEDLQTLIMARLESTTVAELVAVATGSSKHLHTLVMGKLETTQTVESVTVIAIDGLRKFVFDALQLKSVDDLEFLFECVPGDIQIHVPRAAVATAAIHVTGPAACGKSTLTKQCIHRLATPDVDLEDSVIPYRAAVIDVAKTIQRNSLCKRDDILGKHIEQQDPVFAAVLLAVRQERRLLLVLDGIDEVGGARDVLEPYITEKLCREVYLCVTGRENGIGQAAREEFKRNRFLPMQIKPLSPEQQYHIIVGRLQDETRIQQFTEQLQQSFAELGQTPLLLNLMISEFMLHESDSDGIRFDGRIVPGQTEYVASFPGVEQRAWKRVTVTLHHKSVACVWLPDDCDEVGRHFADPDNDGKCFCQTFLYHDIPDHVRQDPNGNFKMIMADSDVHVTEEIPVVGKKVEVFFLEPTRRWWICSVEQVNLGQIGPLLPGQIGPLLRNYSLFIKVDGRGGKHSGEWQYLNEMICSGEWLSLSDDRLNRSGRRITDQQAAQAPFGCMWFKGWRDNVHEGERQNQQAIVVFKKGKKGVRSAPEGLGHSQMKELEYLETTFPERYDGGRGWKEVDAAEFEQEYAMNRAQIYESATEAMVAQKEKVWAQTAELDNVQIHDFLAELAYHSHIRDGTSAQNRKISDAFAQEGSSYGSVWMTLVQPLVKQSRFPLISWEPDEQSENEFMFSHLSFQEYYTARYVVMDEPHAMTYEDELEPEPQDAESSDTAISTRSRVYTFAAEVNQHGLFEKDKYQVVVQMCVELLANRDATRLTQLIDELLQPNQGTVVVSSHLSSRTSVRTLGSLVCASSRLSTLDLSGSGLSVDSITELANALPMMAIKKLILSQNKLFGTDEHGGPTVDANQSGWNALCDALPDSPLEELVVADIGMGVKGVTSLAKAMSAGAVLKSLTVDSTGSPKLTRGSRAAKDASGPRTYTLTMGETTIDLSAKTLGSADVTLLTAWIQRPEVSAVLASLTVDSTGVPARYTWNDKLVDGTGPLTYTLTVGDITIDLSQKKLGPAHIALLTTWMQRPEVSAAVKKVVISHNFIFGSKDKDPPRDNTQVHAIDADQNGWSALCDALLGSPVEELDVADIGMGVTGVTSLAKAISSMAALARVSVLSNPIGADGADALIQVFNQNTKLRTLLGIEEGVTELNLSKKNVDPGQAKILAAELKASRAVAVLNQLTCDSTGVPARYDRRGRLEGGTGPRTYTLTTGEEIIDLSRKNLGPADVTLLTVWIQRPEVSAALNQLTVDSTGDMKDQRAYTLRTMAMVSVGRVVDGAQTNATIKEGAVASVGGRWGEVVFMFEQKGNTYTRVRFLDTNEYDPVESKSGRAFKFDCVVASYADLSCTMAPTSQIDLSSKNIGPADVAFLTTWMQRPEVSAALTDVNMSGNPLTGKMDEYGRPVDGKDISGVSALFPVMTRVIKLNVSECGLGPTSMPELAKLVRDARAVLTDVNMSGNPLTGKTEYGEPVDGKDISGVSVWFPAMTTVVNLNVSKCGLGPTSMPELAKLVRDARAVLASLTLSGNKITGTKYERRQWIYDVDLSGFTSLCQVLGRLNEVNLSDCGLGPASMPELAKVFSNADAVLTDVNMSNNPLTGEMNRGKPVDGKDISGVSALFPVMTSVIKLNVSECGLGPTSMPELAKLVRDARAALTSDNRSSDAAGVSGTQPVTLKHYGICCCSNPGRETRTRSKRGIGVPRVTSLAKATSAGAAAVKKVVLSNNFLFGSKVNQYGATIRTAHADQSGWSVLCEALPGSSVEELVVADIGMGVTGVTSLAKAISSMAALKSLTVDSTGNMDEQITYKLSVMMSSFSIKDAALTSVPVTKGVTTIIDGRTGEVQDDPDGDGDVKIQWFDDGSTSKWTKASSLQQVIASRDDLIESVEPTTAIDLSKQNLGPADVTLLTEWMKRPEVSAVLASLNMSGNFPAGRISRDNDGRAPWLPGNEFESWTAVCDAVQSSQVTEWNISECYLGPDAMIILSTRLSAARDATAVVNSLTLSGNPLTGATCDEYGRWSNVDSNMSGFVALCAVLGKLTEVNLSDCHLGPTSTGELSKVFSDADAALTSLTVDSTGNMRNQNAYTLTAGEANIDLSQKNLGPADVTLLTVWMQRREVSAASINLSGNRAIDQRSRSALQESASSRQPSIELIWN